jgi:drug/metabolite transporter (DMT)-like permease
MSLLWGLMFLAIKLGGRAMPISVYNADRFLVGAVLMLVICHRSGRCQRVGWRDACELTGLGIVGHGFTQMAFVSGVMRTSTASSALIWGCSPLLVALISALLGLERLRTNQWLGALVALVGVGAIVIGSGTGFAGQTLAGDGLVLLSAFFLAIYVVWSRSLLVRLDVWFVTTWMLCTGAVIMLVWSAPQQSVQLYRGLNLLDWGVILWGAVFALLVPNLIFLKGIHDVGRARASFFVNAVPLVGCLAGWFFMGETMGPLQATGGLVICIGILLAQLKKVSLVSRTHLSLLVFLLSLTP